MRKILVLGAGKSATLLIDYLLNEAHNENWRVLVADKNLHLAQSKINNAVAGEAVALDVGNETERKELVQNADIVISLLPPSLHILIAKDCVSLKKNLLTASYINEEIESLREAINENNLLFLCEMGLDPGIDHMSAKKMIDEIKMSGGIITSFQSHCGGLLAPESDDNPWHYKISWNPGNIVHAGKDGARFMKEGKVCYWDYPELFAEKRFVQMDEEVFCWYPNRDSLRYATAYGLNECGTFIRTTLRHPDFIYGWKNIIDLKLTDEAIFYDTDGKTLKDVFKEHFDRFDFGNWMDQKFKEQFQSTQNLLSSLMDLVELEKESSEQGIDPVKNFMLVTDDGSLESIQMEQLKSNAAAAIAYRMHESKLTLSQLFYLGLSDASTFINKGRCSIAQVLQFAMETKLFLKETDIDRVVMLHEIEFTKKDKVYKQQGFLSLKGKDREQTAMAKTVGLPLGIAAKLILNGTINLKGLHIPILPEIYLEVLKELAQHGICFKEKTILKS